MHVIRNNGSVRNRIVYSTLISSPYLHLSSAKDLSLSKQRKRIYFVSSLIYVALMLQA